MPLDKVYNDEPVPTELTVEEAKYILGVQTNLWTEYVGTTQKAEYMLLPHLQAQAEIAWSPENSDYRQMIQLFCKLCLLREKIDRKMVGLLE